MNEYFYIFTFPGCGYKHILDSMDTTKQIDYILDALETAEYPYLNYVNIIILTPFHYE